MGLSWTSVAVAEGAVLAGTSSPRARRCPSEAPPRCDVSSAPVPRTRLGKPFHAEGARHDRPEDLLRPHPASRPRRSTPVDVARAWPHLARNIAQEEAMAQRLDDQDHLQ